METKVRARIKRHRRIRRRITGTAERPRLAVFRSNRHIYAQLIDDSSGRTIAHASSLEQAAGNGGAKKDAAARVGKLIGERAKQAGVETAVFDRGGNLFHGRVKSLADGARESGLRI